MTSPYLEVEEAAAYIKLAPATLYKKASKGLIPSRKHFGRRVFVIAELDQWSAEQAGIKAQKVRASQSVFESARERVRSLKTQTNAVMPSPVKKGA